MTKKYAIWWLATLLIIFAVSDLASIFSGTFTYIPLCLWLISLLLLALVSSYLFIGLLRDYRNCLFTLITIALYSSIVYINAGTPQSVSSETSLEISCSLNLLTDSDYFGFNRTCLFGYPSRQLYLPSIPSLVWGRTVSAMNLGGALWFFFALPIFAAGILKFFSPRSGTRYADLLCAIHISMLFHFRYFNHFIFYYEQSFFPTCFSLLALGFALLYLQTNKKFWLFMLTVIAIYAVFSYTPSLSLTFLITVFFAWLIYKNKQDRKYFICLLAVILAELIRSYFIRGDLSFTGSEKGIAEVSNDVIEGLGNIVTKQFGQALISDYLNYYLIATLVLGLVGVLHFEGFIMASWILASVIAAIASRGYAYYGVDFRIHRANVCLPAWILLSIFTIERLRKVLPKQNHIELYSIALVPIWIFVCSKSFSYIELINNEKPQTSYFSVISEVRQRYPGIEDFELILSPATANRIGSMGDYLNYFEPKASSSWADSNCSQFTEQQKNTRCKIYIRRKQEQPDPCETSLVHKAKLALIDQENPYEFVGSGCGPQTPLSSLRDRNN